MLLKLHLPQNSNPIAPTTFTRVFDKRGPSPTALGISGSYAAPDRRQALGAPLEASVVNIRVHPRLNSVYFRLIVEVLIGVALGVESVALRQKYPAGWWIIHDISWVIGRLIRLPA
jgi:hypothetical protein